MRAKSGFFVVLSSLFLFSACTEIQTNQQILNSEMKNLAGQWVYSGYATSPGCIETVHGILFISPNGNAQFKETDIGKCPRQNLAWNLQSTGTGGTSVIIGPEGKIAITQGIQTRFGIQPVQMVPVLGQHDRIMSLYAPLPGIPYSSFNATAVHQ